MIEYQSPFTKEDTKLGLDVLENVISSAPICRFCSHPAKRHENDGKTFGPCKARYCPCQVFRAMLQVKVELTSGKIVELPLLWARIAEDSGECKILD